MANFVRRIVSGNKTRFRDDELNLELDLVYVTDKLIVMGYPASAFEGIYRNRREDTKKFLDHRHKKNYWLFNFCPIQENSYPASAFDGRVSRYPFPDHHVPPLAILPLATREIRLWLDGSPDRVAVLHCKAGKGRSGTVACAYLLSIDEQPSPPKLERSYSAKEWYDQRADEWINVVEEEGVLDGIESTEKENAAAVLDTSNPADSVAHSMVSCSGTETPTSLAMLKHPNLGESTPASRATLESVLALHTQRRMLAPKKAGGKQKQGVSIASQRRWLHYWSRILSGSAPEGFWSLNIPEIETISRVKDKARVTGITVRMKEPTGAKGQIVKMANILLDRMSRFKSKPKPKPVPNPSDNPLWISLARYDDAFVETLERWESHTRHSDTPGRRKLGSGYMKTGKDGKEENIDKLFEDEKWDRNKMVRRFSTFGVAVGNDREIEVEDVENGNILKYKLSHLDDSKWTLVKRAIVEHGKAVESSSNVKSSSPSLKASTDEGYVTDEASFVSPLSSATNLINEREEIKASGVIVDARREIRAKLYLGKIPMGWFWFIPAFHLRQSEPSTTLQLKRKEIDFPLGPGEWIIDIEVGIEWIDVKVQERKTRLPNVEQE